MWEYLQTVCTVQNPETVYQSQHCRRLPRPVSPHSIHLLYPRTVNSYAGITGWNVRGYMNDGSG